METIKYMVKVNANGLNRAVVLSAIDEVSAVKKASALFRQAELIQVQRLDESETTHWTN
jgi:hypothetical protein